MNLARHISVLWRFRGVVALGLALGIVLAVMAAYDVTGGKLERRGVERWSSESSLHVTQAGFGEGRTILPASDQPDADGTGSTSSEKGDAVKFADPARLSNLGLLYAVISASDQILAELPGHPKPGDIVAAPLEPNGNPNNRLPIILNTTFASTADGARALNAAAIAALQKWLRSNQASANVPADEAVELKVLNRPSEAKLISGPTMTPSLLAFTLCVLAAVALAHILEALRPRDGGTDATVSLPSIIGLGGSSAAGRADEDRTERTASKAVSRRAG